MYRDAPPTFADGTGLGPGIGDTPTSALVMPGINPPSRAAFTGPMLAEEAIAIAAGCVLLASRNRASLPLGLSPTLTARPSLIIDCTNVSSCTPSGPSNSTFVAGALRPLPLSA